MIGVPLTSPFAGLDLSSRSKSQPSHEMCEKHAIVTADVVQGASHAVETFAEAKIVCRIVAGRLTASPVPAAAVLYIDDCQVVVRKEISALGHTDVVDRTESLLEHLRTHNGRTDRDTHTAVKMLDRGSEGANVGRGRPADGPTVVQGMIDDDVVANPRMNGEGYLVPVGARENGVFLEPRRLAWAQRQGVRTARSAPKAVRSTEPILQRYRLEDQERG